MKHLTSQKILGAALATVIAIGGSSLASYAEPGAGGPDGGPGHHQMGEKGHKQGGHMEKLFDELNLTEQQKAQLKSIRESSKASSQGVHDQMRSQHKAFADYLSSPGATESGARSKLNQMLDMQRQMGESRIQTWFKMREVLTPEQQTKFQQLMAEKRAKWADKHQNRKGPKGQGGQG